MREKQWFHDTIGKYINSVWCFVFGHTKLSRVANEKLYCDACESYCQDTEGE